MDNWIKFGLISAILVAISDLVIKYLVSKSAPVITVLFPLVITGRLSVLILLQNDSKKKMDMIETKD